MTSDRRVDLARLWDEVVRYFGPESQWVDHTRRVHGYARQILDGEPAADGAIVEAAAMLHDIGIPEAERRHGSAAGPYQEQEGAPIAREILARLGADAQLTETVAALVGSHHSPGEIQTPEFDVLWDADWLVNLPKDRAHLIDTLFHTATGRVLARTLFS